jgi:hypothetical protein
MNASTSNISNLIHDSEVHSGSRISKFVDDSEVRSAALVWVVSLMSTAVLTLIVCLLGISPAWD